MTNRTEAAKQTWTKVSERSGEYGATYDSNDGWSIEVVLRGKPVSATSREVRYVVCHYLLIDPNGGEGIFALLKDAKRYAKRHEAFDR